MKGETMFVASRHARVFDGVVLARMRALEELALPEDIYHEECRHAHPDREGLTNPAFALWVHAPSGQVTPLCKEHMDRWLDEGDEAGDEDPPALIPLVRRRRQL